MSKNVPKFEKESRHFKWMWQHQFNDLVDIPIDVENDIKIFIMTSKIISKLEEKFRNC